MTFSVDTYALYSTCLLNSSLVLGYLLQRQWVKVAYWTGALIIGISIAVMKGSK